MDAATMPGPQHMLALERANRVRLARAALKRKVAAGKVDAAEVVLSAVGDREHVDQRAVDEPEAVGADSL